jgi:hypothetical protein
MPGAVDTHEFDVNEFHGCARPHGNDGQVTRSKNWRARRLAVEMIDSYFASLPKKGDMLNAST